VIIKRVEELYTHWLTILRQLVLSIVNLGIQE